MNTPTSLPWNLLTRNVHGNDLLHNKIRQKITKLETHLQHFPPDSVHLHIAIERHPRKAIYTAGLTLRLPSNILHSEKSAADMITAFDDGIKALLREIQSFKSELRREASWKGKARRESLREMKAVRFAPAPLPEGEGPKKLDDLVRDLFQQYYPPLVRHARRHVRHDEAAGLIPLASIDPHEIVDEVATRSIAQLRRKPEDMSWLAWFYRLVAEELRRERATLKSQAAKEVSIEKGEFAPDGAGDSEIYQDAQARDNPEQIPVGSAGLVFEDGENESPDVAAERRDLFEHLQEAVQAWPRLERDVFELHFVEGFEPDEAAMIVGQTVAKVQETITSLQNRLREEMVKQAMI